MFYNARWYDAYLNRWTQPDTIIPDPLNPADFDRYSYVRNNPVIQNDPSGHRTCRIMSEDGCVRWDFTVATPDKSCIGDCWDSYLTLVELSNQLGYIPTIEKILYMTMGSEYWEYVDKPFYYNGTYYKSPSEADKNIPLPRYVGREAVARQYYQVCGTNNCSATELYTFLSGYEQWAGTSGPTIGGASARAAKLNGRLSNDYGGTGHLLKEDVRWVLNPPQNYKNVLTGQVDNRPWQFFTEAKSPTNLGFGASNYAILAIEAGQGKYLFMFTALQTEQR